MVYKPKNQKEDTNSKEDQIIELTKKIQYIQADFENYKKHIDKEKTQFELCANESLIIDILTIVDDLERATEKIKNIDTKKGIEIILNNLKKVLEKKGVVQITTKNQKFDPYYHEALLGEKSDDDEGKILEELSKGYMLNKKVIRHSKVKVAKN